MSGSVDKLSTIKDKLNQKTRSFVLKDLFKNVSKMKDAESSYGSIEEHFGVPWCTRIWRCKDELGVYLYCMKLEHEKEWSINTEFEIHVFQTNGSSICKARRYCFIKYHGYGWPDIMTLREVEKEYLPNDEVVVEIHVKITKMTGIEVYLRRFDDEECSDVALLVDGENFHVSKLYLASQSSYFKSMFLGKYNEVDKKEIELTGIDGYDLQKYLEMLYGEDALDDNTVGGILHLADMYDTKILIGKCEEYLLEVSTKALKEKLEMSVKHNLVKLREKCMSEIKTLEDIRSVLPADLDDMDHSLMASLFKKTLDLK